MGLNEKRGGTYAKLPTEFVNLVDRLLSKQAHAGPAVQQAETAQATEEVDPLTDIADDSLHTFLQDLRGVVEKEFRTWPIATSTLRIDPKYPKTLHIAERDVVELLVHDAREKGIVIPADDSRIPRVNKDGVYALGSLAWSIGQIYPGRSRLGSVIITDSRKTFPWPRVISGAREGLGKSRFAPLINDPIAA